MRYLLSAAKHAVQPGCGAIESQAPILPESEPAALAGPVARGIGGEEETIAFRCVIGRRGDDGLDDQLHDRIQPLQGFVMGDVFLGLRGRI